MRVADRYVCSLDYQSLVLLKDVEEPPVCIHGYASQGNSYRRAVRGELSSPTAGYGYSKDDGARRVRQTWNVLIMAMWFLIHKERRTQTIENGSTEVNGQGDSKMEIRERSARGIVPCSVIHLKLCKHTVHIDEASPC